MPRIGDTISFAGVALALTMGSRAAAQQPVDANRPIVLPPALLTTDDRSKPEAAAPAAIAPKPVVERQPAASRPATPATSESRSLGKPNGPLSSRPLVDNSKTAATGEIPDQESSGWLGAIDPRRNDFTRVLGALAAVVGLILLTRTLAARYMPSMMGRLGGVMGGAIGGKTERPSGVMEVLARYPIGRGQQLLVLKFARRIILVHQAGASARTLSEMTDPDEVAATLARLEAGASARSAGKFKAALQSFETEHEAAQARRSRSGAALAATETEIIDLTRTQIRHIGSLAGARRSLR